MSTNFPEFKWKERDEFNDIFEADATITSSATTVTLVSTSGLYA